ncbi:hypothetical protein ASC66_10675 [Leifsonia sp. Root4]|uniref:hypothetical protein n=1 Tax=Leifsonia sp. Root4 TaxID=1736525 RepID=UPI0006FFCB74|nr:hypothetical protein [Leifsonia sp. Root4]KQW05463.1 hypothetical protein ASC66_10675 [Leifsonia sp. Root4]
MSDNLARTSAHYARPAHPAAPSAPTRTHIEIVPSREQRKARPKLAYGLTAVLGIIAIIAAQLVLSVVTSQGAYDIAALQLQQKEATRDAQILTEDLDRMKSPQFLAANAQALGMVTNANPAYLQLSDGAVLGQPFGEQGTSATGASALVPNALLSGVPLVTEQAPDAAAAEAPALKAPVLVAGNESDSATPSAPVTPQNTPELPLQNGIPAPSTH